MGNTIYLGIKDADRHQEKTESLRKALGSGLKVKPYRILDKTLTAFRCFGSVVPADPYEYDMVLYGCAVRIIAVSTDGEKTYVHTTEGKVPLEEIEHYEEN